MSLCDYATSIYISRIYIDLEMILGTRDGVQDGRELYLAIRTITDPVLTLVRILR